MQDEHSENGTVGQLETPIRNHYFYGQLLGVQQFTLETDYGIQQRRLLNRLVLGYGVVCGLAVELSDDGDRIAIAPGLALDRAGRELVVAGRTPWISIPPDTIAKARRRAEEHSKDPCIQVLLCYHECRGDPEPVNAGDCGSSDPCSPSTIRERYRVEFRSRCTPGPKHGCIPHLFTSGGLDHEQLARWVTEQRACVQVPEDTCIPLANLRLADDEDRCHPSGVDNWVRPVVASNVVLMELILALVERGGQHNTYD